MGIQEKIDFARIPNDANLQRDVPVTGFVDKLVTPLTSVAPTAETTILSITVAPVFARGRDRVRTVRDVAPQYSDLPTGTISEDARHNRRGDRLRSIEVKGSGCPACGPIGSQHTSRYCVRHLAELRASWERTFGKRGKSSKESDCISLA